MGCPILKGADSFRDNCAHASFTGFFQVQSVPARRRGSKHQGIAEVNSCKINLQICHVNTLLFALMFDLFNGSPGSFI
jgi:hypothetical protein